MTSTIGFQAKAWLPKLGLLLFAILGLVTSLASTRLNLLGAQEPPQEGSSAPIPADLAATPITLPAYRDLQQRDKVERRRDITTIFPDRPPVEVRQYEVQEGDSVFGIAAQFDVKPETILWSNFGLLQDDPHLLRPGQFLNVLPVDGAYYQMEVGDSLDSIAEKFNVRVEQIIDWPGNQINPISLQVSPGKWLVIPGGARPFRQWFVPTIARGSAGVGAAYGPGGCSGNYSGGAVGGGGFIWPTSNHLISGNDYWPGHLAIDISSPIGAPVGAADGGVVVFSGWANGGYGNMVMIDHGNGWQTVYAHMERSSVVCGQSVAQGSTIGFSGSTGNSTGPHLHFETRYLDGFVNPWYVLP